MGFVKTESFLDTILTHKLNETEECKRRKPMAELMSMMADADVPRDFAAALRRDAYVALIAEVKKASPSKGVLIEHFDPVVLGTTYAENGAAAISVLTDERFFQGNIRYMTAVREAVSVPVLCKEFIVDAYQIYEARAHLADAVLLITAALEDPQLIEFHSVIRELGMTALVEVHNAGELERAIKAGATVIGVNNRDLRTFHEDLNITEALASAMPVGATLVAESAIRSVADVQRMAQTGAHAVLVGEGLVKSGNIAESVKAFASVRRG